MTFMDLPAGIYNVAFGPTVWRSVEIRAGETTTLDPGVLEVHERFARRATRCSIGKPASRSAPFRAPCRRLSVLPSTFTVMFGNARWDNIEIKAGEHKVLNPAVIVVEWRRAARAIHVRAEDGTAVGNISSFVSRMPVPPGKYTIEIEGQKVALDLAEGQTDGDQREVTVPVAYFSVIFPRRITSPKRAVCAAMKSRERLRRAERHGGALGDEPVARVGHGEHLVCLACSAIPRLFAGCLRARSRPNQAPTSIVVRPLLGHGRQVRQPPKRAVSTATHERAYRAGLDRPKRERDHVEHHAPHDRRPSLAPPAPRRRCPAHG